MNPKPILEKLNKQSAEGRKVCLLLAYVSEHGPQSETNLIALVHSGKPLRVAVSASYLVLTPDGLYSIAYAGSEVVQWLLGRLTRPKHLADMEVLAAASLLAVKKLKRRIHQ